MSEKINNEDILCGAIYENGEYTGTIIGISFTQQAT